LAVKFVDRFMKEGRNVLSGADVSEGALYVLFAAVMALAVAQEQLHICGEMV